MTWKLSKPGWPWGCLRRAAIHPAQRRKNGGSLRFFQLDIIAPPGALNLARPVYMLIAPLWGLARCIYCSARTWPRLARPIRPDFAALRQRLARPTLDSSRCFVCFEHKHLYAAAGPPDPRATPPRVFSLHGILRGWGPSEKTGAQSITHARHACTQTHTTPNKRTHACPHIHKHTDDIGT